MKWKVFLCVQRDWQRKNYYELRRYGQTLNSELNWYEFEQLFKGINSDQLWSLVEELDSSRTTPQATYGTWIVTRQKLGWVITTCPVSVTWFCWWKFYLLEKLIKLDLFRFFTTGRKEVSMRVVLYLQNFDHNSIYRFLNTYNCRNIASKISRWNLNSYMIFFFFLF